MLLVHMYVHKWEQTVEVRQANYGFIFILRTIVCSYNNYLEPQ